MGVRHTQGEADPMTTSNTQHRSGFLACAGALRELAGCGTTFSPFSGNCSASSTSARRSLTLTIKSCPPAQSAGSLEPQRY